MTEEGEEPDLFDARRKQSKRERFRDRLLKKADIRPDKFKTKEVGPTQDLDDFLLKTPRREGDVLPRFPSPLPSPSREPVPRIRLSSSPHWPDVQDAVEAGGNSGPGEDKQEARPILPPRRKRPKGLRARFTDAAAEIIGEGGDDAENPPIWISQVKNSNATRSSAPDGPPKAVGMSASPLAVDASTTPIDPAEEEVRPRFLKRAPTGFMEVGSVRNAFANDEITTENPLVGPDWRTVQNTLRSDSDLAPSSGAGLEQTMLEEEAQALTSGPTDVSIEPLTSPEKTMIISSHSRESPLALSTASKAGQSLPLHALFNPLSPSALSPWPSRPSSSSSHESMPVRSTTRPPSGHGRPSHQAVPSLSTVPKLQPLSMSPVSKEDALAEFRSHVRRYFGLFSLAAEGSEPAKDAPLSRWIRAAAWWFLAAEANFKLLRKDLEEGISISQITTSRRHMQAVIDLAKTAWIVEDIVPDYSKSESMDLSNPGSIERQIQNDPNSSLSHTLRYWQDLSGRYGSLVAAIQRNGFMTSTPWDWTLSTGIDTTIWLTSLIQDSRVATWLRSANPPWVKMDETLTPVEPFDLSKTVPLTSTADIFRSRAMFCQTSGGFRDQLQSSKLPCILTIARRSGSYALVLFVASQDHCVNVVIETDPLRGDAMDWQQTSFSVHFSFADGFNIQLRLQQADFMHLTECYDLSLRVLTAKSHDAPVSQNLCEDMIFKATSRTFERRSVEKLRSFPYVGEQKDCEILLFEKQEVLGGASAPRSVHQGFRLCIRLSPYSANLGIFDVNLGGNKPILLHSTHEHNPPLLELVESRHASLFFQFSRTQDFNSFYELLTSFDHLGGEHDCVKTLSLHSFSVEPSSKEAGTFLSGVPWSNVQITRGQGRSCQSNQNMNTVASEIINISVLSTHAVIADRLVQGHSEVYMGLSVSDATSLILWHAAQREMSIVLRFRAAASNAPTAVEHLLAQSKTNSTRWKYTFGSFGELHAFQECLTGANVSYDGTASSFAVSRGSGLRIRKEELGVSRLQILHHNSKQIHVWHLLAYFTDSQCIRVRLDANDIFEKSHSKGKFSIRLVGVSFSHSAGDGDGDDEKRGSLCLEDDSQVNERDNITIMFDNEDDRDRMALTLPCSVRPATSIMGALHLK